MHSTEHAMRFVTHQQFPPRRRYNRLPTGLCAGKSFSFVSETTAERTYNLHNIFIRCVHSQCGRQNSTCDPGKAVDNNSYDDISTRTGFFLDDETTVLQHQ